MRNISTAHKIEKGYPDPHNSVFSPLSIAYKGREGKKDKVEIR